MYLGTEFHRYWARGGAINVHPDDLPYLKKAHFMKDVLPCPFDGPLEHAKVVICLANPSYQNVKDKASLNSLILAMRSGEEDLPDMFSDYYKRITGPLGEYSKDLQKLVAIFNVCPYASNTMDASAERMAAGLPSVWQAQQYLRQVLIPRAQTGNIYLVIIRKLQLWGVTETASAFGNLRIADGNARNGVMSKTLGEEIRNWILERHVMSDLKINVKNAEELHTEVARQN